MKKLLGSLMGALLIVFIFGTTASAAKLTSVDIENLVNNTNISIDKEIIKAQEQVNTLRSKYDAIINNYEKLQQMLPSDSLAYNLLSQQILEAKSNYNAELDKLVNKLIQKTNGMAYETIRIAAENGYTVICELVEVQIGERIVLIDPLRVSDT